MSDTRKDLKSYRVGFGKYGFDKPARKMKPLAVNGDEISGERSQLVDIDNDISQDGFNEGRHWYNAKWVRAIREQLRRLRKSENSSARFKIKQQTKKDVNEELDGE
jgi:hypothetical protein